MNTASRYQVDVPEGKSGPWSIQRFTVSPKDAEMERLRAVFGGGGRGVPEGTYTMLSRGGTTVMSDTPDEIRDHREAIRQARGRCLVAGLGIGMVAQAMLNKPEVTHVTIIELSSDVIALTGPWLTEKFPGRVTIIQADILSWTPPKGEKWDTAWFDIWDNICTDNLAEMKTLSRRFGRRANWKGSWSRSQCEYHKAREKRDPWARSRR
jgi:hypothetical protein